MSLGPQRLANLYENAKGFERKFINILKVSEEITERSKIILMQPRKDHIFYGDSLL
jgi:hypothetical protein